MNGLDADAFRLGLKGIVPPGLAGLLRLPPGEWRVDRVLVDEPTSTVTFNLRCASTGATRTTTVELPESLMQETIQMADFADALKRLKLTDERKERLIRQEILRRTGRADQ